MQRGDVIAERFVLEDEVAVGGMGRIFRAHDRVEGRTVALKAVARADADDATRFARESAILARVGHPGIVRYVAHGAERSGAPWLAMEWLEGEDLLRHLARRRDSATIASAVRRRSALDETARGARAGDETLTESGATVPAKGLPRTMSVASVLVLLRRVASALAALHGAGIVHRDLKPSNVFLVGGDVAQAKLLDLGTARTGATPGDLTRTGMLVGTPAYMAPEQARAESVLGPAVDVWALGVLAYECLSGAPPFSADHVLAILARILLEDPAPLREARPETPEPLAALLDRMLAKEPGDRPRDGAAVLEELEGIEAGAIEDDAIPAPAPSIGAREQRVRCVMLARAPHAPHEDETLRSALDRAGARAERLAEGSFLATLPPQLPPGDQALRAARAAIQLRDAAPRIAIALATGRAEDGARTVGPLVDRAAAALEAAHGGEIVLDDATAALLEGRFDLGRRDGAIVVAAARDEETARTLLGRPTRTVGRRRELGILTSTWEDCAAEPRARAVLVTAPPGVGKSRLRSELVRAVERRGEPATILLGQGDSLSAGSPFVVIGAAIRRSAGILDGEPLDARRAKLAARLARTIDDPAERARVAALLGEVIGAPVDDADADEALRAARHDPMLLAEQTAAALVAWLRAETARAPVLLVVEDLHWGDRPSVRLLDQALRALEGAPLLVVAFARPEVHEAFPQLFGERATDEIRLEVLTKKASIELARDVLGGAASEATLEAIADRAAGNALYLEEIIRAVAQAGGELAGGTLPDTVIGMVQARLESLGGDARRILRAASVFGESFWEGGVRALAGAGGAGFGVAEWLEDLARRELVTREREARIPGEQEHRFRHALVRDAAYATFTEEDRALAHRLAAEWLESVGERDPLVLASHHERGGDRPRAIGWLLRAGELALEANDLEGAIASSARAIALGASGAELGALRGLSAGAAYWQSRYADSARDGREACALLARGSERWLVACGSTLVSLARIGDHAAFDALFAELAASEAEPGAEAAQLVALCRGTFQLIFQGRFADADATLARIAERAARAGDLDALTRAQVSHVRGVRAAMVGDVGNFLVHLERAVDLFERAGDVRNASLERTTVGWCYAEIGMPERAVELVRASLARAQATKSQQAITYAKANLGYALERAGALGEARAVLGEAIAETRAVANKRLEGWAHGYLVPVLRASGDLDGAEREARTACELLASAPGLLAWALAEHARSIAALGRPAEALPIAREAMAILERLGGLLQGESLPPLVLAEVLEATGDRDAARAAAIEAARRLALRADRLPDPSWRHTFLALRESRETLALAARLAPSP